MSVLASQRPGQATAPLTVVQEKGFPKKVNPREKSPFYNMLLENTSLHSYVRTVGERRARREYSRWATEHLRKEAKTLRDNLILGTHDLLVAEVNGKNPPESAATPQTNEKRTLEIVESGETNEEKPTPLDLFAMRDRLFAIMDELDKRDGSGRKLLEVRDRGDMGDLLNQAIRELNLFEREYWP